MKELKQKFIQELRNYCANPYIPVNERSESVWEVGNDPRKIVIYVLTCASSQARDGWELRRVPELRRESGLIWFVVLLKTGLGYKLDSQEAIQVFQESKDGKVYENKIQNWAFRFISSRIYAGLQAA